MAYHPFSHLGLKVLAIALALEGGIERGLSPDQLRERLRTLVMQRRTGRRARSSYDL